MSSFCSIAYLNFTHFMQLVLFYIL